MLKFSFFLTLISISCYLTTSSPLYHEQLRSPGAKVILPDPLEEAPSEELPMLHNNNYEMIMPDYDDQHSAASMQLQNFEEFYDPDVVDNNEYKMVETQFVHSNPVRSPQPLTPEEHRIRQKLETVDEKREKKVISKLRKGSTKPRIDSAQWDQFDYDLYSVDPAKKHKKPIYT